MPFWNPEPKRETSLDTLEPYVAERVARILARLKVRGFDPVVFEARRSYARQKWLYGVGRTHSLNRKPISWTMSSRHLVGKAVDIISKSRLWNWPEFYVALREEAEREDMQVIKQELCHIQYQPK